jgi:hypothetical protein
MKYEETKQGMNYEARSKKRRGSSNLQTSEFRLQRGVAIYLAILIMTVLLAIVLGITTILIGQLKIGRGIENSIVALYAADTGIEHILYEEKLCRQVPCAANCYGSPASDICLGLPDGYSTGQVNLDNGANYTATAIYGADEEGKKIIKLKSIGEYKGVKRAIETTMPHFTIITLDYNDALDWVRTAQTQNYGKDAYLIVSYFGQISLIKWSLADIPPGVTINSATFYYYRDYAWTDSEVTIYLWSVGDDSWTSGGTASALWEWPTTGTISSYTTTGGPVEWLSADITSVVKTENAGDDILSMKWGYSASGTRERYASPSYADNTKRPYIEVIYR